MGGVEILLELCLLVLLTATMLHAIRLHRALGAMRQDRETLMDAVAGFDSGTRQAEAGLGRLRDAAEHLGGQLSHAAALKDDLQFLSARGEQLADRLDALVRTACAIEPQPASAPQPFASTPFAAPSFASAGAPALAPAAVLSYRPPPAADRQPSPVTGFETAEPPAPARSQAERDLLLALRAGRL